MTDDIIERAAQAASDAYFADGETVHWSAIARAVLSAALSDPSEAMVATATQAWLDAMDSSETTPVPSELRAMRAALVAAGRSVMGSAAE
jgi:hypothetical protein